MRVSIHRLLTHRGIVVATFAATLALLVLAFTAPGALAAPGDPGADRLAGADRQTGIDVSDNDRDVVIVGGNAIVPAGQTVDSVTAFGGNAVVAGTVRHTVVAVGGDVILRATARVGTDMKPADATVFAIGGTTRTAPGAVVTGSTGAWQDVTSGEALVAAAIAMTGFAIAGAVVAALVVGLLTLGTLTGAALLAAFIWLIVWLVRRDSRPQSPTYTAPTAYSDAQPYDAQTGEISNTAVTQVQYPDAGASASTPATA